MRKTDRRKQSFYIPICMLDEMEAEAKRQGRSLSWIVQNAWRISHRTIAGFPDVPNSTEPLE